MQAQSLRQQTAISSKQSLEVIKTLLTASFGCITYLRNLLPEENFGEGRLLAYASQESSMDKDSRHASSITVKTVTRGFSTEGDKLLNYLEHGIFEAIERQYLKSFIFAIYLDSNDRNNIVESYTYNLTYYTVPGTATTVPILSLNDQLDKLSLNSSSKDKNSDAVVQAMIKGRAPTLGDVKQSVKSLLKSLIILTQSLDPLPRRRFATFQLLYRENTPDDYEPPYFRPGNPEEDKFVFTTHDKGEVPEKISVGTVVTPYHGIDVQVQSIARFLPSDDKDNLQYFGINQAAQKGLNATHGAPDSESRTRQIEALQKDAEDRKIAWRAQDSRWTDEDAEGEDDPDYVNDSGIAFNNLLGLRQADGSIVPIRHRDEAAMDIEPEARFFGKPDVVPSRLGQLRTTRPAAEDLEPTQQLDATQAALTPRECASKNVLVAHTEGQNTVSTINTQMLRAALDDSAMDWTGATEMLDMETQATNMPDHDSIRSYSQNIVTNAPPLRVSAVKSDSENVSCTCEHEDDDDVVFCEMCEKWLHIRCMGYYSAKDPRLPAEFVCIPCRLQSDAKFSLIEDKYPEILNSFVDLALFRRAIKYAEQNKPESLKEFRKLTKCGASLAEQQWNRLEREGFILLEVIKVDKSGLLETRTRATRSTKKVKSAKQVQKYVFNEAIKRTAKYRDYFSPDSEAEKNMIGLGRKLKLAKATSDEKGEQSGNLAAIQTREEPDEHPVSAAGNAQDGRVQIESQTQDETQVISTPMRAADLKRRTGPRSQETVRTNKKVRISVVEEDVDIEE